MDELPHDDEEASFDKSEYVQSHVGFAEVPLEDERSHYPQIVECLPFCGIEHEQDTEQEEDTPGHAYGRYIHSAYESCEDGCQVCGYMQGMALGVIAHDVESSDWEPHHQYGQHIDEEVQP